MTQETREKIPSFVLPIVILVCIALAVVVFSLIFQKSMETRIVQYQKQLEQNRTVHTGKFEFFVDKITPPMFPHPYTISIICNNGMLEYQRIVHEPMEDVIEKTSIIKNIKCGK